MKTGNTAANVVADLEKKVAENNANASEGTAEVARTKEPRVKLTDVIIKLITEATYLPEEGKTTILAEIDKVINKVTNAKPSLKSEIRTILENAPETGISRDELFAALAPKHPDVSPFDLALSIYGVMQPVNYRIDGGKYGWQVKVATGGNYIWVK